MTRSIKISLDHEGWLLVMIFALATVLGWWMWEPLGTVGMILTAWCCYFFRDPDRMVPQDPNLIISPADGMICNVSQQTPPTEWGLGDQQRWRISIFMNVFDVHVNRLPCSGTIKHMKHYVGKFFNASLDKASDQNERQLTVLTVPEAGTRAAYEIAVVQIAGLIARRIRADVTVNQQVDVGERLGIIRFGSRVDVYLPPQLTPRVAVGQKVIAGESILADFNNNLPMPPKVNLR